MQKKMMAAFAALCTMAALMTGCTDVSDGSQTQVDMNAATTAAETTAPAETAETEPAAETAETDTDLSASEEESTAETTDAPAAQSQETIGDTGMTADQWVAQAQQIYDTACQTYYTYRCTSDCFTYDNSDTTEDGYVRITSCDSIEAAGQRRHLRADRHLHPGHGAWRMACESVHYAVLRRLYHVSEIVGRHHCRSALLHHAGTVLGCVR